MPRRRGATKNAQVSPSPPALDSSSKKDLPKLKSSTKLGGRGNGGRGLQISLAQKQNIHLPSVTLEFEQGNNVLLQDSPLTILQGHVYGLVGRNGTGKSTLLQQLYHHNIPGMPTDLEIRLVQQHEIVEEDASSSTTPTTVLDALVQADTSILELQEELERLEEQLEEAGDSDHLQETAERYAQVVQDMDELEINADAAQDRARSILKGLGFSKTMISSPTSTLSGGWRMRLALSKSLFTNNVDLILLDECTNHLDLAGQEWLAQHIVNSQKNSKNAPAMIVVSHDRAFLDAVCTDIVVLEHQRLTTFPGSYSNYQQYVQEKLARQSQILDAAERQRTKAIEFVQSQQKAANSKSSDPNKQRQAKMIRDKKLDRIGNYRQDGKRYKNFSLKKLSETSVRLAEKVHVEQDAPLLSIKLPNPTWPPSIRNARSPIVQLEQVDFAYGSNDTDKDEKPRNILSHVTLDLCRGSKVAVVGNNGSGKSTTLNILAGRLEPIQGTCWSMNGLVVGHLTQYSVEESLQPWEDKTLLEYAQESCLLSGKASSKIIQGSKAGGSGNVRQYLGAFGLGGSQYAHRPIGTFSGGERMRLCFATVLSQEPHLLLLDESTNHLDMETLDSLSKALDAFEGSIVVVSHNQSFLAGFCNELWTVDHGTVTVHHSDTVGFDDLFTFYRQGILSSSSSSAEGRVKSHQTRAALAHRSKQQNQRSVKTTSML